MIYYWKITLTLQQVEHDILLKNNILLAAVYMEPIRQISLDDELIKWIVVLFEAAVRMNELQECQD